MSVKMHHLILHELKEIVVFLFWYRRRKEQKKSENLLTLNFFSKLSVGMASLKQNVQIIKRAKTAQAPFLLHV